MRLRRFRLGAIFSLPWPGTGHDPTRIAARRKLLTLFGIML